jgi:hypothetical protein
MAFRFGRWWAKHPIFTLVILAFFVWLTYNAATTNETSPHTLMEPTQPPSVDKEVAPAGPSEHTPIQTQPPSTIDALSAPRLSEQLGSLGRPSSEKASRNATARPDTNDPIADLAQPV